MRLSDHGSEGGKFTACTEQNRINCTEGNGGTLATQM